MLRLLHTIPDYLIDGRPFPHFIRHWHVSIVFTTLLAPVSKRPKALSAIAWNIVFPPSVTERSNVRYQLSRITKALPGRNKFMLMN